MTADENVTAGANQWALLRERAKKAELEAASQRMLAELRNVETLRIRDERDAALTRLASAERVVEAYTQALRNIGLQDLDENGDPDNVEHLANHSDAGTLAGALIHCATVARDALRAHDSSAEKPEPAPFGHVSKADECQLEPCATRCDHGSPCKLPRDHHPAWCHETEHGCICYDPEPAGSTRDPQAPATLADLEKLRDEIAGACEVAAGPSGEYEWFGALAAAIRKGGAK